MAYMSVTPQEGGRNAENARQLCSRIAQRLNVPQRVRLTSSLVAASLDGHFEHPAGIVLAHNHSKVTVG